MKPRAIVVEDSVEYLLAGTRLLEDQGFEVLPARTGEEGVRLARTRRPELMLVDLVLPGIDGFEVCRQVRAFSDVYLLVVTARDDEVDAVVALRTGADDYVTKPYSRALLSARVEAVRRRPRQLPGSDDVRVFGDLTVDLYSHEALLAGELVPLTRIEFALLAILTAAPRRAFTRLHLLQTVWGYADGDAHVVDVHVANLRRKLGESASEQRLVRTVRGIGYRFEPAPALTRSTAS